ncbi:hypothetical protein Syun_027774 [Stephania yunnanensis]|uniref:Uncharacterized protein n=1 Tax=Stephania yunnanensis TaxID=152371 RepID=A0AAP0HLC3_9MAGN
MCGAVVTPTDGAAVGCAAGLTAGAQRSGEQRQRSAAAAGSARPASAEDSCRRAGWQRGRRWGSAGGGGGGGARRGGARNKEHGDAANGERVRWCVFDEIATTRLRGIGCYSQVSGAHIEMRASVF